MHKIPTKVDSFESTINDTTRKKFCQVLKTSPKLIGKQKRGKSFNNSRIYKILCRESAQGRAGIDKDSVTPALTL